MNPSPRAHTARLQTSSSHWWHAHVPARLPLPLPRCPCSRTCNVLREECIPADEGGMTHIIVSCCSFLHPFCPRNNASHRSPARLPLTRLRAAACAARAAALLYWPVLALLLVLLVP